MAAPIYSYRPEIKIEILDNDVTVNLGDVGSCTIRKNLYQPAGEFQLVFPDLPVKGWFTEDGGTMERESLYGLVNPLDRICIWMRRWRDDCPTVGPWVPVLTGFVRSVGRDEQVGPDGRPQRQVVVAGQDCGGAFLMEMVSAFITYQNNHIGGVNFPARLNWMKEYGLTYDLFQVQDFIWNVATKTTQSIMQTAEFEFQQKFYVNKGYLVPQIAFSQEGTVWELLYRYADGPWNELFVRENRNMFPNMAERCPAESKEGIHDPKLLNPELVFRPTPWLDYDENPLPDVNMDSVTMWNIDMKHVVALRAHRDDAELVNHVWIHTPAMAQLANSQMVKKLAGVDDANPPGVVNPGTRDKFGDRVQQEATRLMPFNSAPNSQPKDIQRANEDQMLQWAQERQRWVVLAQANIHNFERGSITMKGYPMMRVGDYFRLHRGDVVWHGYVTNIVHDFQPYRRYLTTMDYIRGSQIKVRRELQNPWDVERKTGEIL